MRIYSWNVNGIRAIWEKGFAEWVQTTQPDLLCLQETKLHQSQIDPTKFAIPGYHLYWNCADRKGYSGVATYTKLEPLRVARGFGIPRFDTEGRVLITEFAAFTVLNIYFPNGQMSEERLQYKLDFYAATLDFCNHLRAQGKKLIICGDYNTAHRPIDLKNPKANEKYSGFLPVERAWLDKLLANGYIDTFRYLHPETVKYSWWSYRFQARAKGIGWRIDYHFITDDLLPRLRAAEILDEVQGSDHCPVMVELNN